MPRQKTVSLSDDECRLKWGGDKPMFGLIYRSFHQSLPNDGYVREHLMGELKRHADDGTSLVPTHVQPGEYRISHSPAVLDTDPATPCVGIAIWDPDSTIGLLGHAIWEIESDEFAADSVERMLTDLEELGVDTSKVQVKLFGGGTEAGEQLSEGFVKAFKANGIEADTTHLGDSGVTQLDLSNGRVS